VFTLRHLLHLRELVESELEFQRVLEHGSTKMRERWQKESEHRELLVEEHLILMILIVQAEKAKLQGA